MTQKISWIEFEQDIKIESMGLVQQANRHPARTNAPYWVLVLMDEGQRTLSLDGREIYATGREFFLLPPYTDQQPLYTDLHTACYIHFYAKSKPIERPVRIDASRLILPTFGHLPTQIDCFSLLRFLCEHAASPYASEDFMRLQFLSLLSHVSLHSQKNPRMINQKGVQRAEDILSFIKDNYSRSLRADDYEAEFDCSYHQLNAIFKRQFGCTVKQFHMRLRMERAAELLRNGRELIEVAQACGFEDYFFFIRSFSQTYGISPAAYRKQNKK